MDMGGKLFDEQVHKSGQMMIEQVPVPFKHLVQELLDLEEE